jgi:hypothetical protein
LVAGLMPAEKG